MRRVSLALALIGALAAGPVLAADPENGRPGPGELLDEAGQKLMQALRLMLQAIPQYAAPEFNENGDIIIRRIRPEKEKAPAPPEPGKPIETTT